MIQKKYWLIIVSLLILEIGTVSTILILQKLENQPNRKNELANVSINKNPSAINWSESITEKNIKENLPVNYEFSYTKIIKNDLDNDGQEEIIVCALPSLPADEGKILVIKPLTPEGGYKKIAETLLPNMNFNRQLCGGTSPINSAIDFDNDGIKELILELGTAGAYTNSFGIFKIDNKSQKINWVGAVDQDGQQENFVLLSGSSLLHQNTFEAKDLNGDSRIEIIEKTANFKGEDLSDEKWQNSKNWEWNIEVYRWENGLFVYNKEMSEGR